MAEPIMPSKNSSVEDGEELDDLLLQAAGRTAASGRTKHLLQPSRSRNRDSDTDEASDHKDDDANDSHGYAGRKPSRSHVPLKKRSKRDVDQVSDDEDDSDDRSDHHEYDSSDDSDVGSDLYKDEDDRQQLAQLTELERELILSDRASKKDDKKLHKQMKSRCGSSKESQSRKETSPPAASCALRTSARFAGKTPSKNDALNVLRARRMKRDSDANQRLNNSSAKVLGSRHYSPTKQKNLSAYSLIGSSESESGSEFHSEDDRSMGDGIMGYSDKEGVKPESVMPTFEDIKGITVRRSKLAKWLMEPFFDDLIVGCFVRIGIGVKFGQNIYRLCIVKNVDLLDPNRQYLLDNKTTYKYLKCVWGGESSAASWQMARVSDSPPSGEEFVEWVKEVRRTGGRMPSKKEVLDKMEAIEKINNFVYSAATVKQMLQEKKSTLSRPPNIAAEKDRLRREMEKAQDKNATAEVASIRARLQELEAAQQAPGKDRKALSIAEMNRKNRVENLRNASVSKRVNTSLKAGDAEYDPFSRRWTRPRNYYAAKPDGSD
ncbi:hypothetical protein Ancab_011101 [Ancistrocladus abbreviatus]